VASNRFGFDLYLHVRDPEQNAIFSPLSVSLALAMAAAGARGATLAEMSRVLHVDSMADAHGGFGELLASLPDSTLALEEPEGGAEEPNAPPLLHVADRLWTQSGRQYRADFLALLHAQYRTSLGEVDFIHAPSAAVAAINAWVERQTRRRIQNLLEPQDVSEATRLVLTNAIYFKGSWQDQFRPAETHPEDFAAPKKTIRAPMMRQLAYFSYAKMDRLTLVELPYLHSSIAMVVILPDADDGLSAVERRIGREYDTWVGALAGKRVDLWLPRWKETRTFPLAASLQALGLKLGFDAARADFSAMTDPEPDDPGSFYIGAVIQKAFVQADEFGAEAAAATAVVMTENTSLRMEPPPPEPVVFHADHPFLYVIRDRATGTVFFVGRVVDPTRD
jgi:serpin B